MRYKQLLVALCVAAPIALTGCTGARAPGEVAARVNAESISVSEVTSAIGSEAIVPADGLVSGEGNASRAALENLINRELLWQQALRAKLDRDPAVIASIDAARKLILAQTYLDRAAAQSATPGEEEISSYYRAHPELFARRRLYLLRELNVSLPASHFSELRVHADAAHDLLQVEHWLRAADIPYTENNSARSSDEVPREVMPAFRRLRDGDIGVARVPSGAWVVQLIASAPQPLTPQEATPGIERYLQQRLREAVARAEIQRLRDTAHIEYLGRFATPAEPPATPSPSDTTLARLDSTRLHR